MAMNAGRARKLAERIVQIVAEMLERRVKDPRLGFVTVTEARLTGDLREATVYYTVYGTAEEQADTAAALASATGLIRSEVGRQTGLRHTPSLTFVARHPARGRPAHGGPGGPGPRRGRRARRRPGGSAAGRRPRPLPPGRPVPPPVTAMRSPAGPGGPGARGSRRGARPGPVTAASGLVIVDKPAGLTSHDVVARIRRLAGTRRVGHAGTLDPMATGVLVVGVEKATRLLGHLALTEKEYLATIRLGQATDTGDAEGTVVSRRRRRCADAGRGAARPRPRSPGRSSRSRPPSAPSRWAAGGPTSWPARGGPRRWPARAVTVHEFTISDPRPAGRGLLDVTAAVRCSSGTYVRALARDLGESLGVGGHLTMLRRTRVGPYDLEPGERARRARGRAAGDPAGGGGGGRLPGQAADGGRGGSLSHGASLSPAGAGPGPVAALAPDGTLVALVEERDGRARPLAVFVP